MHAELRRLIDPFATGNLSRRVEPGTVLSGALQFRKPTDLSELALGPGMVAIAVFIQHTDLSGSACLAGQLEGVGRRGICG